MKWSYIDFNAVLMIMPKEPIKMGRELKVPLADQALAILNEAHKGTGELELEQQRGNLLPMELVIAAWQGHIANSRAKLLALPPKAASQVLGMESYLEVEHAIRDIIYEALDELAGDGVPKEYEKRFEVIAANLK